MEIRRNETHGKDGKLQRVSIDVSPDDFWTRHYISCDVAEYMGEAPFHKSPTVRIGAASFSGRTSADLRKYAAQMLELAYLADKLQEEMEEKYKAWVAAL